VSLLFPPDLKRHRKLLIFSSSVTLKQKCLPPHAFWSQKIQKTIDFFFHSDIKKIPPSSCLLISKDIKTIYFLFLNDIKKRKFIQKTIFFIQITSAFKSRIVLPSHWSLFCLFVFVFVFFAGFWCLVSIRWLFYLVLCFRSTKEMKIKRQECFILKRQDCYQFFVQFVNQTHEAIGQFD